MEVLLVGEFKTRLPTQYTESARKDMILGQAKLYNFGEVGLLKRKMGEIAELIFNFGPKRGIFVCSLEHQESAKSAVSLHIPKRVDEGTEDHAIRGNNEREVV